MPHRKSLSLVWRRIPERYNLIGKECQTCGTVYFPPRHVCPKCRRRGKIVDRKMKGTGKVVTYTEVHVPPDGFEKQAPYLIGIVELDEGAKVTGQIVNCKRENARIGMKVEACFKRINEDGESGIILYGYKFRPVGEKK